MALRGVGWLWIRGALLLAAGIGLTGALAVVALCVGMGEVCGVSEDAGIVATLGVGVGAATALVLFGFAGKTLRRAFHESTHRPR